MSKNPVDSYLFGWRIFTRKISTIIISTLFSCAILHLFFVSFFIKSEHTRLPEEIFVTFILFSCAYLSVLLLWLITTPFFIRIEAFDNPSLIINSLLYYGISHTSPFRLNMDARPPREIDKPIYKIITENYHNDVLYVVSILFSSFILMAIQTPHEISNFYIINKSNLFYFSSFLVAFYGAGSSIISLVLIFYCRAIDYFST